MGLELIVLNDCLLMSPVCFDLTYPFICLSVYLTCLFTSPDRSSHLSIHLACPFISPVCLLRSHLSNHLTCLFISPVHSSCLSDACPFISPVCALISPVCWACSQPSGECTQYDCCCPPECHDRRASARPPVTTSLMTGNTTANTPLHISHTTINTRLVQQHCFTQWDNCESAEK